MAARLQQMIPNEIQIIVPETGSEAELMRLARDVEVILCVHLSAQVAQAASRLRFIQKTGAGVDAIPFDVLSDEVYVANTSGANPRPLVEGAVALVLALAKNIVNKHNHFPHGTPTSQGGVELRGKQAGIIGFGSIGADVGRLLHAFEMKIFALKRNPAEKPAVSFDLEVLGGPEDLDSLLQTSDFVIITVPLTPETRGLIGERELRLMKPTSYIVNIARAAIIQEDPLYRALSEGWIAGAGLDVWWPPHWWSPAWFPEGATPKHEFWKLPNVIATPHNVGRSDVHSDAGLLIIAENLRRIARGQPPINQVDKHLRY